MKIIIINGPNLNLLGVREKNIYGSQDFQSFFEELKQQFSEVELSYFQSNHEGEIVDKLHEVGFSYDGVVLNAGAYTHTSAAIGDAIAGITTPVVEVHISNVYRRETFRHHSYLAPNCIGVICGFGLTSYRLGVESLLKH
ncbi:type II 3-dehydroquinate dehydratase [Sphingobacterium gobiense]|uniref:3-dehydroquinate dehydratase n=1 Tax=Sphingobacterium gobiense TaxID=1382456 RepID=A0A2S9JUK9_9SPHI|nr:type II 3-dehydroquinate dehydratase [Sphingobacterium gobiense]PRD56953.1 type II 3-dehydroquinate dehydratase [Sphingobacterium gobiense]